MQKRSGNDNYRTAYERERDLRYQQDVANANANSSVANGLLIGIGLATVVGLVAAFLFINQRTQPETPVIPQPNVEQPDINVQPPDVNVQPPNIDVEVPENNLPEVQVPDVNINVPEADNAEPVPAEPVPAQPEPVQPTQPQ